jgi:CPA2 family monovalent cation:H+ antiporter-2
MVGTMEHEFLKSLVIIFGVSAFIVFILDKLRIPSIAGFLVAGAIIGPYGVGFVHDVASVEVLAEIGVVLLLFTIGIELSMARLIRMRKAVLGGGGIQVLLTILLAAFAAYLSTGNARISLFFGFLIALSSTAVVLKVLAEKGETDSPHGLTMMGILIFQDLCVVPLMLLLPVLSEKVINAPELAEKLGMAALIVVLTISGARWIVPVILHQVVHTKSRELFITTIIFLCLGIALLTSKFGLSLALGAFLAGLAISESEYSHQATSDILPFRDSFMGMFFVSVGMLMDIGYMSDNLIKIAVAVVLIFALKLMTGTISALAIGNTIRTSIIAGLGLSQIGEFSFVLAVAGRSSGLITGDFHQLFISSSVITMIATPFILSAAPSLSAWITSRRILERLSRPGKVSEDEGHLQKETGHVIIIGFGLNGRNLARVLREAAIPYAALEMNSDTVKKMRSKGETIYYGDGTSKEILHRLGIEKAKLLVVAISDPSSTRRIVSIARHESADIFIIVRTRYFSEIEDLRTLGANEVIPEEFETSVEIFSRVLHRYNFPYNVILDMIDRVRESNYSVLRSVGLPKMELFEKSDLLPEMEIEGYTVPADSHITGKSISDLQIRTKTGVTIIAVRRGQEIFTNPAPGFIFSTKDVILFTGERNDMNMALHYFRGAK